MRSSARLTCWAQLLVACTLLLAAAPRAAAEEAQVLFDDFEDGDALGWTHTGTTWSIAGVQGSGFKVTPGSTNSISTAGSTTWTDYALQARLVYLAGGTSTARVGLVFRYTDALNFYAFHFNDAFDTWDLRRTSAGTESVVARVNGSFAVGQSRIVNVSVQGATIRAFVDGQLVLQHTDAFLTNGSVGLYTTKGNVLFDDVRVENADGTAVLWDSFEDGDAIGWSGWGVDTRLAVAATSGQALQAAPGFNAASSVTGDRLWDNLSVEAKVKAVTLHSSTARFGIVFRYRDAANYYVLYYNGGLGSWDLTRRSSEQGERVLGRVTGAAFPAGSERVLKVDARGPTIRAFVDGMLLFTHTDSVIGAGQVGVYTTKATVAFDDVRVQKPAVTQDIVIPYPLASYEASAQSYAVTVNGQSVPVHRLAEGGYAHFAFAGRAQVTIEIQAGFTGQTLSPIAFGIPTTWLDEQTLSFTIDRPMQLVLTLDVNGEPIRDDRLFLLADSLEDAGTPRLGAEGVVDVRSFDVLTSCPDTGLPAGPANGVLSHCELDDAATSTSLAGQVLYFPPGDYELTKTWYLPSGTSIYLAGGAYLKRVGTDMKVMLWLKDEEEDEDLGDGSNHVAIRGRGTLDGQAELALIRTSGISGNMYLNNDIDVEGLVLKEIPGCAVSLAASGNHVRNVKALGIVNTYFNNNPPTRSCGVFPGSDGHVEDSIIVSYDDNMNWSPPGVDPRFAFPAVLKELTVRNIVSVANDGAVQDGGRFFTLSRPRGPTEKLALENIFSLQSRRFIEVTNATTHDVSQLYFKQIDLESVADRAFLLRTNPYQGSPSDDLLGGLGTVYFQDVYASPRETNAIYARNHDKPVRDVYFNNYYDDGQLALDASAAEVIFEDPEPHGNLTFPAPINVTFGDASPPIVSVEASDMYASTAGSNPGMFTFRRSGDFPDALASALTFDVSVRGSAEPGVDYQAPSGFDPVARRFSVTIPAGKSSASVLVTPIAHGQTDLETMYVSIESSGFNTNYLLAPAARPVCPDHEEPVPGCCAEAGCGVGKSHQAVVSIGVQ